jgi:hypothetical protein
MDRGRQGGLLEGLREALGRLFAPPRTVDLAMALTAEVGGDAGAFTVERVDDAACGFEARVAELEVPQPGASSEPGAILAPDETTVASDDAGAVLTIARVSEAAVVPGSHVESEPLSILPVALPTSHTHLDELRRPVVASERARLPARATTAAAGLDAAARARSLPVPASKCGSEGGPVRRCATSSRAVRVPGAKARSEPRLDIASEVPLSRRPQSGVSVEQRLAAIRAVVRRSGVPPRSLEVMGLFGPVPAIEPARVRLGPDGTWVRLWYPVGARCGASSLFAVARSTDDGSLHAALLSDAVAREND